MADIFREIDEELRQERAERLWRRYGKYAIGGAVAVVVAIAAYTGWQEYRTDRQLEAGAKFAAAKALAEEGKTGDAEALFAALGAESGTAYGVLARFHAAALRASSGDRAGAALAFRQLAGGRLAGPADARSRDPARGAETRSMRRAPTGRESPPTSSR